MRIEISNGLIIDPANGIETIQNLYIANKRIVGLGTAPDGFEADSKIDATGKLVIPGVVDLSARLGEPGFEKKADIDSECRAAVRAGVTTICIPPDTMPVIDSPADIEFIKRRQRAVGLSRLKVIAALTVGLEGKQLSEMAALKAAGCVAVSNVNRTFETATTMRRAMEYAASLDLTVIYHPEIKSLTNKGCAHEGSVSTRLGLSGIPEAAETSAIGFMLPLVEQTGVRMHFARLSTARGMNMIRRARYDGLKVTADVCAHQLFLTEMDVADFNPLCHTLPPLRAMRDRDALREGLSQRGLDAICSDHQPHENDAKLSPFPATEPGISGIETLLPLTFRLVEEKVLGLSEAIALITHKPAELLGLDAGALGINDRADVVIIDPECDWEFSVEEMLSRGKNSPFQGWAFRNKVTHTLIDGKIVYSPQQ